MISELESWKESPKDHHVQPPTGRHKWGMELPTRDLNPGAIQPAKLLISIVLGLQSWKGPSRYHPVQPLSS